MASTQSNSLAEQPRSTQHKVLTVIFSIALLWYLSFLLRGTVSHVHTWIAIAAIFIVFGIIAVFAFRQDRPILGFGAGLLAVCGFPWLWFGVGLISQVF